MAGKKSRMDPKRFEVANRIFFRLYQAQNLVHKNGTRFMIELGSTTQQWAVLGALARPPVCEAGMTVKDLIEYLLLSRQNLTAVIDRLEERGWVERVKDDDDGRSRRIRLTREGNKIWARMLPIIDDFYSAALAGLDDKERVELYRLLQAEGHARRRMTPGGGSELKRPLRRTPEGRSARGPGSARERRGRPRRC